MASSLRDLTNQLSRRDYDEFVVPGIKPLNCEKHAAVSPEGICDFDGKTVVLKKKRCTETSCHFCER